MARMGLVDLGGDMVLGTVDRRVSLLGVDSLLSVLFEGDDSSFYARLATYGADLIRDKDFADRSWPAPRTVRQV